MHDNLAQEQIKGTPDMTPAGIAAAVKESKLTGITLTETALGTALNTSYFASSVGLFAIIVGNALLLISIGLLVLTVRWIREPKPAAATRPTPAAPIAPVPA